MGSQKAQQAFAQGVGGGLKTGEMEKKKRQVKHRLESEVGVLCMSWNQRNLGVDFSCIHTAYLFISFFLAFPFWLGPPEYNM